MAKSPDEPPSRLHLETVAKIVSSNPTRFVSVVKCDHHISGGIYVAQIRGETYFASEPMMVRYLLELGATTPAIFLPGQPVEWLAQELGFERSELDRIVEQAFLQPSRARMLARQVQSLYERRGNNGIQL